MYIYDTYKCTGQLPEIPAAAIRRRGEWIPGVIDPSAKRRNSNGIEFVQEYIKLGLDLTLANNAVEPGIARLTMLLSEGRFKVMSNCTLWLEEYRLYRYNTTSTGYPEIAKNQNDHAMDATRYLVMSGLDRALSYVEHEESKEGYKYDAMRRELRGRDRDSTTGY